MRQPRLGILGGLAALAIGIGVAAAGVGHLLQSMPTAHASDGFGPTITGGVHPWVNLAGQASAVNQDTVIYTVPADRIFVLTGGCVSGSFGELWQDGTQRIDYLNRLVRCDDTSSDQDNGPNLLRSGNAHVVFDPGSQVVVHHDAAFPGYYYFEGYLARP